MKRRGLRRLDERGLRAVLAAFFVALAVPAVILTVQAYDQLKWQAFRSTQVAAEELAMRIDGALRAAMAAEDARPFGAYSFLVVEGDAAANFVQRSPLSALPVASALPGVLGYFQVDAVGKLTTPLLPGDGVAAATYGITAAEEAARAARVAELRELLARNRLVRAARNEAASVAAELERPRLANLAQADIAATAPAFAEAQRAFDQLASSAQPSSRSAPQAGAAASEAAKLDSLSSDPIAPARARQLEARPDTLSDERQKRIEQSLVAEPAADTAPETDGAQPDLAVVAFESEVDPFKIGLLDTGHLVMFRNVWRDGQRYIQGALVDRPAFVAAAIDAPYRASSVAGVSRLTITYQGQILESLSVAARSYRHELAGTLLHRTRLSPPFGDLELAFAVDALPRAPGAVLLAWVAVTLAVVLCGGFLAMYRFAAGQMRLARQQQDFVSAVSHELKTPLTSIRMYGEMLKAGWADEAKRQVYYEYIHSESERLSRLIENVLKLARLTRNTQHFDLATATVSELMDMVRSKVATQVERAGFALELRDETRAGASVVVDADCFTQIFINLVDNALKFSAQAANKVVELAARTTSDGGVLFTVRDFGPGVPKAQMKRIFELFYRPENELTRETVGTGIGLALVRELALAMEAHVDVRNCEPGAEFRVQFQVHRDVDA